MPKFNKKEFYNKTEGIFKTFSYTIAIPKKLVEDTNLADANVKFSISGNKIIIEKDIDKK